MCFARSRCAVPVRAPSPTVTDGEGRIRAELIAVGEELLYGDIVNGNAAWLGQRLAEVGVTVSTGVVVGDRIEDIAAAVRAALARADTVILTGGLGPTQDDLTREALALAAGVGLRRDAFLEGQLRRRFDASGRAAPAMNFRQADLPVGAKPMPNERGTAPGVRLELAGGIAFALPGVPHEMEAMFTGSVLPDLLRRAGSPSVVVHRVLRTAGMWESAVAEALSPEVDRLAALATENPRAPVPRIAFLASEGETRVRITVTAASASAAEALIAPVEQAARAALGVGLYGADADTLPGVVHRLLAARSATVATAESITGGLLAGRLTDVPGASATFRGGVVAYATDLKAGLLGVPDSVLATGGPVSEGTASAMAAGVRSRLGATYGVSLTGVAGPEPQDGHPPGEVWLGLAGPDGEQVRRLRLPGERALVRTYAVVAALDLLRRALLADAAGDPAT